MPRRSPREAREAFAQLRAELVFAGEDLRLRLEALRLDIDRICHPATLWLKPSPLLNYDEKRLSLARFESAVKSPP